MKKLFVLALAALMMALLMVPAAAADTPYYFFAEVEDTTLTGDMVAIDWDGASGGKAVVGATTGYEANNFAVDVEIPADGTYSVWVRAWVKSNHQCAFFYANDFGGVAKGKIFKMAGNSDGSASYVWFPLDVRTGINDNPDVTQSLALTAGTATFSLGVRSIANVADPNRNDAKTIHYLDCILITSDNTFDPNTGDWAKIRDDLLNPPADDDDQTPPAGGDDQTPPAGGDDQTPPAGDDTTAPDTGSALLSIALIAATSAALVIGTKKKNR